MSEDIIVQNSRLPFWSDDFDMDLLKVLPDALRIVDDQSDARLWTCGGSTHGRLNHPSYWNGLGAIVWNYEPQLQRDRSSTSIQGYATKDPLIECTWLELLRDVWAHGIGFVLITRANAGGEKFPAFSRNHFYSIMANRRGWTHENVQRDYVAARKWLCRMNRKFTTAVHDKT
jgi:hypothetical protein